MYFLILHLRPVLFLWFVLPLIAQKFDQLLFLIML